MARESDMRLLCSIVSQMQVIGIDFTKVAQDVGAPDGHAASNRWSRLREKLIAQGLFPEHNIRRRGPATRAHPRPLTSRQRAPAKPKLKKPIVQLKDVGKSTKGKTALIEDEEGDVGEEGMNQAADRDEEMEEVDTVEDGEDFDEAADDHAAKMAEEEYDYYYVAKI